MNFYNFLNHHSVYNKFFYLYKVSDVTNRDNLPFCFSPISWYNRNMMTIILLILAYLLGSIPSGLWIGQAFFNINLREHGSGNTGTTNTFRILGKKAGMATFVIDFFKGTLATLLPLIFHVQGVSPIVFGLLAVIGHTFPIFAKFKGGKAVATSAGVIFGFAPLFCLYLAVIFFGILYLGSMISLSSISAAIAAIIGALLFPLFGFILTSYDLLFTVIIIGLASLVIVRHKDNIKRIQNKTENLIPWGLNITHQEPKK